MNNKKVFEMMSHYYNDYDETIKQSGDIQQEVIDPDIQDLCPECNINSHTTWHLFNCPAKPTPLTVLSLWKQPEQAAAFLGLIPVAQDEDIDVD